MTVPIYKPFEHFDFNDETCFLSGEKIASSEKINVFSTWLLEDYNLFDKPFKLLDESITTYNDIKIPCSSNALIALSKLDNDIKDVFNLGYHAVKQLDEELIFQWISKLVYGIIYHEIRSGIRQQALTGEKMNFSQSLVHKFNHFHLMLQSVIRPVVFDGVKPWSIVIFPVNNAPDTFNYRDEINTLTFSLRMKDFGIVACLQDNGTNALYHKNVLDEIPAETKLHPIQFEEICARFFYSAYLFNRLPEYTILPTPEAVYIEAMPLRGISNKPLFDPWGFKTYGQVLENFWKPWGFLLLEIIKDPENPTSFLLDSEGSFISPETISLEL